MRKVFDWKRSRKLIECQKNNTHALHIWSNLFNLLSSVEIVGSSAEITVAWLLGRIRKPTSHQFWLSCSLSRLPDRHLGLRRGNTMHVQISFKNFLNRPKSISNMSASSRVTILLFSWQIPILGPCFRLFCTFMSAWSFGIFKKVQTNSEIENPRRKFHISHYVFSETYFPHFKKFSSIFHILKQNLMQICSCFKQKKTNKQTNSIFWVHERTIPTERPPLVGEVIAYFCG
jgi:hypothetical protein